VFEGVAYNSRWLLDTVERFIKRPLDGLNFIGGGATSDLWCQMHADICDRTIRRVAEPQHANSRGAAFVAWLALGRQDLAELNRAISIDREFHPDPTARRAYEPLYAEFAKLYKAHKPIHARLNG
jgi:xylulokinase